MNYLDTSAFAPIFLRDAFQGDVERWLDGAPDVVVSDFTLAEYASVVSRHVRTRTLTDMSGLNALGLADEWVRRVAGREEVRPEDVRQAEQYVRRFDLGLRAPDALHLSIVGRLGLTLATFDDRMAAAAQALGLAVLSPAAPPP